MKIVHDKFFFSRKLFCEKDDMMEYDNAAVSGSGAVHGVHNASIGVKDNYIQWPINKQRTLILKTKRCVLQKNEIFQCFDVHWLQSCKSYMQHLDLD